jgi:aminoglycoside N3'-acetyltransferase
MPTVPDRRQPLAHGGMDRPPLVAQLRALGVDPAASPLMVHASLRRLGPVEGGAQTIIDALLDTLGDRGTLVVVLGAELGPANATPFDCTRTPAEAGVGILAEIARRDPRIHVNDHPAGRFGAIGPLAQALLEPMPLHDYLGPGSLLDRFTAGGGHVLRLGADTDTVTLTHLAEYRARLPYKRRACRHYRWADGRSATIDSLDDIDGVIDWHHGGDYFSPLLADFLAAGLARCGRVGRCDAELFDARHYVEFATGWLEAQAGGASDTGPGNGTDSPA